MKTDFCLLLATLMTSFLPCVAAQEATTNSKPPTLKQMTTWVEELANRDPKPFEERYVLEPPRKVDRDSLKIAKEAYDNLSASVTDALPTLIAALDDERYSYYQESPSGAFLCHTVGEACYGDWMNSIAELKTFHELYKRTAKTLTESNELWFEGK